MGSRSNKVDKLADRLVSRGTSRKKRLEAMQERDEKKYKGRRSTAKSTENLK